MSKLKELVRTAHEDRPDFFVAPAHTKWLELPEAEQVYSAAAIDHVVKTMRGDYNQPRSDRFSPSALGKCLRRQTLGFAGAPALGEDPDSQDLMGLGKWGHMRWQAEGLSYPFDAPYMIEVERFVLDRVLRFGGSIDGILSDGSGFELKTAFFSVFNKVMETGVAKWEHRMQKEGYRALTAIEVWSFVYEERGTGNYFEIRSEGEDTEAYDAAMEELERLNEYVDADRLPPLLPDCELRAGKVYKSCPFRKICPRLRDLEQHSITEARTATLEAA